MSLLDTAVRIWWEEVIRLSIYALRSGKGSLTRHLEAQELRSHTEEVITEATVPRNIIMKQIIPQQYIPVASYPVSSCPVVFANQDGTRTVTEAVEIQIQVDAMECIFIIHVPSALAFELASTNCDFRGRQSFSQAHRVAATFDIPLNSNKKIPDKREEFSAGLSEIYTLPLSICSRAAGNSLHSFMTMTAPASRSTFSISAFLSSA